jgi:hypothetical protein
MCGTTQRTACKACRVVASESVHECMIGVDLDGTQHMGWSPAGVCLYVPQETCLVCQAAAALFSSRDAKIPRGIDRRERGKIPGS